MSQDIIIATAMKLQLRSTSVLTIHRSDHAARRLLLSCSVMC